MAGKLVLDLASGTAYLFRMGIRIESVACHLPDRVVTNAELALKHPQWDMPQIEARAGVRSRHVAESGETALDLAAVACEKLFTADGALRGRVDGLVFCTQSPDYVMPPNCGLLQARLGLGENLFAFDFNLACSGYVYGLAIANGLLEAGLCRTVLLVNADTYSKYIHPLDRSAGVLFGDGAAATVITADASAVFFSRFATSGAKADTFIIPAGACRTPKSPQTAGEISDASGNVRTPEHICMNGMEILAFVNTKVVQQVRELMQSPSVLTEEIEHFFFHQASKLALDSLTRALRLDPARVFRHLEDTGNTVSASIPVVLVEALAQGKLRRGQRILLSGFGVGLSWGTIVLDF